MGNVRKRGAIELSITTIVVIIIGLAILGYGLVWVKGLFEQFTSISDDAIRQAKAELEAKMGSTESFYMDATELSVRRGETKTIKAAVRNTAEGSGSKIVKVKVDSVSPSAERNHNQVNVYPDSQNVEVNKIGAFFIEVKPTNNAVVGKAYYYIAKGLVSDKQVGDPITFQVKVT